MKPSVFALNVANMKPIKRHVRYVGQTILPLGTNYARMAAAAYICLGGSSVRTPSIAVVEPITVVLDLHVSIDDVPIGLSLQRYGPFKFSCHRLWVKPVADVNMSLHRLGDHILDTNVTTLR